MQFEMNHKVGTDYSTVRFTANIVTLKLLNIEKLKETFSRIGGQFQEDYSWTFPSFITSEVLEEVIRNTCFVCAGLMRDDYNEEMKGNIKYNIAIRKCSSCGHSHI